MIVWVGLCLIRRCGVKWGGERDGGKREGVGLGRGTAVGYLFGCVMQSCREDLVYIAL